MAASVDAAPRAFDTERTYQSPPHGGTRDKEPAIMAPDDEGEDLYDDEFDFVDDDDDDDDDDDEKDDDSELDADDADAADDADSELDDEPAPREAAAQRESNNDVADDMGDDTGDDAEEKVDEYGRPEPAPNYVVHIYEYRQFKRTIDRPFTGEDAEAFASEYNRTSKPYGRFAVAGKDDAKPRKALD